MKLSREEVQRIAELARLRLTADEEAELTAQLDEILRYMEKLNALDTTGVEPFAQAGESREALRDDRVTNSPAVEAVLGNAPDRDRDFFRVPKILE